MIALFCHASIGETLTGGLLLYLFRVFERLMGSSKFIAFAFVTAVMASTLQLAILVSFPSVTRIAPGPYPLLFALFVQYYGLFLCLFRLCVRAVSCCLFLCA